MNILCLIRGHRFSGCTCTTCGKVEDKNHDWQNGCVCRVCGKKRDEMHDWRDGCVCHICGKKRDSMHDWDQCLCRRCGKTRPPHAHVVKCKCTHCGAEQHEWVERHDCSRCPNKAGGVEDMGHLCGGDPDSGFSCTYVRTCAKCGATE